MKMTDKCRRNKLLYDREYRKRNKHKNLEAVKRYRKRRPDAVLRQSMIRGLKKDNAFDASEGHAVSVKEQELLMNLHEML